MLGTYQIQSRTFINFQFGIRTVEVGEGVAEKQSPVQTTKTYGDDVDTDDAERKLALVFAWDDLGAISCCRQQSSKAMTRDG